MFDKVKYFKCYLQQIISEILAEKNIYEAIQFHLEGLKEAHLNIPKSYTEVGTLYLQMSLAFARRSR